MLKHLSHLTGVVVVTVVIRTYNAPGELDSRNNDSFTLGKRVLLTCDVTGLPQGSELLSYRWHHNCTRSNSRCEIQDGDPYYRVVRDTLLVDVTSWDQGGRYYCSADYLTATDAVRTEDTATGRVSVAG